MVLCKYLKECRKNPHCSLPCCLALNNLQGEIHGLGGRSDVKNQLQAVAALTVAGAMKDADIINVTTVEGEQQNDDTMLAVQKEYCPDAKFNREKCHKLIQTEQFLLSIQVGDTHL